MRTRNRGQRTSFVSSLGLCPRKNRRKQVTQYTGLALSGHASRGRRFRKRSMFRSALLLTSGTGKRLKSDRIRGTPTKPTPSPSKPTSLKRMADNPIALRRPSRAFRGRRGRGSRASTRASIPSCPSRTSVRASTRRTWRRGRKRKFPGLTRPVSFVNRPHSGDVKSEVNTSAIDPQNETVVGILKNQEVHDDTPSLRPRKRRSSRIGSPYICSFYPRRGSRTTNNVKAADDAPLSSKPSPPIKQEPFKSLFLNNFQHTPGKRKRGRPSSPAVYLKPPVSSSSVSSGTRSSTRPASVYRSSATIVPSCAAPKHAINSAHPFPATPNPSALLPDDLRSRTGDLKFGSADEVLLEILREVDTNGCVPKVQKHSDLSRSNMAICKDESIFESEASFIFDTPLVATVFDNMLRPTVASLFRLEVKDLFLAINGLVRPGVCDLWRRRREEKTKQLSRSVMGRLRPNPRPRLYSDMVISGNSGHSSSNLHMNVRHAPLESSVLIPDKVRQGSRSVALAAARLTAAKRLIRDRSRRLVGSSSSVLLKRTKRSRTPKVETSPPISPQIESKKIRAPRSTSKISSQTAINTRGRRRPDVKHHIDWKFCYTNTDQETVPLTSFGTTLSHRRRKTAGSAEVLRSEDAVECPRSSPVLVSEGTLCTDSEEGKSVIETVEEEAKEHLITPEVALSEVAEDETLEKLELADSQIDASALSFPSGDGRRKRRHALTVQRKRPAGRSVGGFGYREADAWKDKYSLSTKFEDNSSASSSSISGIPNAFSRVFRQSSWLHGEHSKSSFSKHLKFHGVRPISSALLGESRSTRSLGVHKIQRISASTLAPRRNPLSVRVAPPVSPRQRITRRPDRMCQLTLLDRLVLGLNCSVSRNGGEIHIKQLHAEELNILTQRMNKTGFFIQSLALRTNSHNDAEYNLVLTFSPTAEGVTRRTRCPSSTRSRIASSEHSLDYPSHSFTERIPCRKIRERSRSLKHLRSCLSGIAATKIRPISPRQSSQNTGYVSDSAASLDRPRRRSSATRFVHSDGEESEPVRCPKILHTLNIRKLDAQKPSQWASTGKHNKVATTTIKLDGTGGKWSPRNLDSQTHIESVSSPSNRRPTTSHAERFLVPSEGTSGHRRPAMLAKIRQDRTFVSEPHSGAPSPSVTTGSNSYGTSKRASRAATPVASVLPPFRRHSPRKIIRKVYTGSLTIPKILNRKRPTGGSQPALSVPLCSSSTAVTSVPGLASSSFSQHVPTVVTATPSTSTQLSGVVHSTSSNTMSSVIYEDSNRASPAFSQSLSSSISVQYRRLPTVTSAAVTSETPTLNYSQAGGSPLTLTATSDRGSVELSRLSGAPYSPPHVVSASTAAPNPPPSLTTERELGRITPLTFPDHAAPMQPSPSPYIVSPSLSTTRHTGVADHDSSRDPQMHQINLPAVPATSESPVCASPAVPSVPFPANDQRVQKPLTESSSQPLPINTRSNTGPDLSLDFDDIYTPANSMSASQLLKLKRIHDESGHPFTQTNESRPNQFLSPSGRVQSPSNSARSPQSQSNNTETRNPRGTQANDSERSQLSSSQFGPVSSATLVNCGANFCSVPVSVDSSRVGNSILPLVPCENEETDDFELRAIGKSFESPVDYASSFPSDSAALFSHSTSTPLAFHTPLDPSLFSSGPGLPTTVRFPRPTWPAMRTGLPVVHPSSVTLPVSSSGVTTVHTINPVRSHILETLAPNQVATRVMVQNPATVARIGDFTSLSDSTIQSTTVNLDGTISSLGLRSADASMRSFNLPSLAQSTGLPVITGPNKRTVVHKYHSFRKILPKSPEHPGSSAVALTSGSSSLVGFPTLTAQPRLTHFPVVTNLYRTGPLSRYNSIAYDSSSDPACVLDFASNLSVVGMRHKPMEHGTFGLGVPPNPASQLLKSLLESSDSKDPVNNHLPQPSTTSSSTNTSEIHGPITSSAPVGRNQVAHQSRGTWQLGKRAISTTPHRPQNEPGSSANISRFHHSISSNIQIQVDATEAREPRVSDLSDLPSPIRLIPGSTSRLQQLQQHYQRRQQMQLEQQHQPKPLDRAIPSDAL